MRLKLLALSIICKYGISDGQDLTSYQIDFATHQLYARIGGHA